MENKDKLINSYQSDETIMMFQPDYNDILNSSDDFSEFLEYKDSDLESDSELDSILDFNFDFDMVYDPNINNTNNNTYSIIDDNKMHFIEIKSKIVNKIKLNANDLIYIKKLEDDEKFELIKIFNHIM